MNRSLRQFLLIVILPLLLAGGGTIWLTADLIARVSTGANQEDHLRTHEVVKSALNASRQQLANLVADNANWDDAAVQMSAAEVDVEFVASTWGDPSASGVNYDAVLGVTETGAPIIVFSHGEQVLDFDPATYFGGRLLQLIKTLPQNSTDFATASSIVQTPDGAAIVAAGNLVPTTPDIKLPDDRPRFLVFVKYLTPDFIAGLGTKFVVQDLRFLPATAAPPDGYTIANDFGDTIGALQWRDRRPGDLARGAVLAKAYTMLCLLIGVMSAIALLSWRQFRIIGERERQATNDARQDMLTGLPNRFALNETLAALLDERDGEVCMVFVDLDGFKEVNDTYDHETGDILIKSVAAGIAILATGSVLLSRIGGDEFVALFTGRDAADRARHFATRVIGFLETPFDIDGKLASVGASLGIAAAACGSVTPGELMRRADIAMYKAKSDGKNRYCLFDAETDAARSETAVIGNRLRAILEHGTLECAYQPIIDAASLKIVGMEALARWPAGAEPRIAPDRFIYIAETSGLINQLGDAVLARACRDALAWPGLRICVNVSPVQLRNPNFAEDTLRIIDASGLARSRVELEVTEGTLIDDIRRLQPMFERLHRAGVAIALDDFGAGYSSIAYLRGLTFNRIKIDRSLIAAMLTSEAARYMVQATGLIARGLGARVTAEGVESAELVDLLRLAGCDEMQGFYFGRPAPAAAIAGLLQAAPEEALGA